MNKNTGIQSALTNGTPVPPPQVRTTPLDGGGPVEQQKTDERLAAARSDYDDNDPRCDTPGVSFVFVGRFVLISDAQQKFLSPYHTYLLLSS
jgi:hypothetical protein